LTRADADIRVVRVARMARMVGEARVTVFARVAREGGKRGEVD